MEYGSLFDNNWLLLLGGEQDGEDEEEEDEDDDISMPFSLHSSLLPALSFSESLSPEVESPELWNSPLKGGQTIC